MHRVPNTLLRGAACLLVSALVTACASPEDSGDDMLLDSPGVEAQANGNGNGNGNGPHPKFHKASGKPVVGQYVVVFDDNAPGVAVHYQPEMIAKDHVLKHGGAVLLVYRYALRGYLGQMNEKTAKAISHDPRVLYVVEDEEVDASSVQEGATWGLDRIDERALPSNQAYQASGDGQGVHAYVLDSGIYAANNDFGGRVSGGQNFVADGGGTGDCHGHGTHVAGTLGGTTYGVAKGVSLHPVRVLDCVGAGSWGRIIAGVDWITGNGVKPAVVNASLSGGAYAALDTAIQNSIAAGFVYVVAAGNNNANACNYSPARVGSAITVGSTDANDARAWNSNWGACVDLFAPGVGILSAGRTAPGATKLDSGTSMAAPHVAGVAALYLQRHPTATQAEVAQAILEASTQNVVTDPAGSPNKLLYSLFVDGQPAFLTSKVWSATYSDALGWSSADYYYGTIQYADVNGDGNMDACGRGGAGILCSLGDGNKFGPEQNWQSVFSDAVGWSSHVSYWSTIRFPDVNGDGKADVCARADTGIACALSTGSTFGQVYIWSGAFDDNNMAAWSSPSYWQTIQYPDLNGDGKADLCGRGPQGLVCALSTGSAFAAATTWGADLSDANGWNGSEAYWGTIRFPDLNGDGRDDLCVRIPSGIACALSTGSSFGAFTLWTSDYSDGVGWNSSAAYYGTIQYGDLDGDGKDDICGRGYVGMLCARSTGAAFTTPTFWTSAFDNASGAADGPQYWKTIQFTDVNADGRADLCGRLPGGVSCSLSAGTSLSAATTWTTGYSDAGGWSSSPAYWSTVRLTDLNGDGRADVCGRGAAGLLCTLASL